ncbi:MAG: metalloregulator ArsR/SmtB family transcription factor [Fretibacterium sp.]|nr:metalloregulator ArsR/SmtB family transcription factor [Fretibacterium sp.]
MDRTSVLKAIADETRMRIITLLLQRNYCVRALARKLEVSEAAVSQHLKVLRGAGLLVGEKIGYFVHYDVKRDVLHELTQSIESLIAIERKACSPEDGGCWDEETTKCHNRETGSDLSPGVTGQKAEAAVRSMPRHRSARP